VNNSKWKLYGRYSDLIHFLEKKLLLPENVVERSFELLDRIARDDRVRLELQTRRPASIAAAIVYIAGKLEGEPLTQREILEALNWSIIEVTLSQNYHRICKLLGIQIEVKQK